VVNRGKHDKCICDIQIGWACTVEIVMVEPGEIPRINTNWPEHSAGCELFTRRKK
jgi:hypothetical protein